MGGGDPEVRVLLVAQSPDERARLERLVSSECSAVIVGFVSDLESAARMAEELIADVLLYSPESGEPAAGVLRGAHGAAVLLLSDRPVLAAPGGGSAAPPYDWSILPRRASGAELSAALAAAALGLVVFRPDSPAFHGRSPREADGDGTRQRGGAAPRRPLSFGETGGPPRGRLTGREREVLLMMSRGLANKAIAAELGITSHTVKFHIASIMQKLDAESRTQAVTRGLRRGIIPL